MDKKRVMIIDDDKEFLEELKDMLELSGYELVAVNDSGTAVEAAKKIKPAVVLLDLKMPQKNGFQIANELRYFSELARIPIIAMSAFYKDSYKPLLEMCGIKKCLIKPFQPLDVISEIEKTLTENRGSLVK
jgi:DNA-binding response OmpR family regulator